MATKQQIADFISRIAPLIRSEAQERGYHVASPIIAQACIESAYGTSKLAYAFHNYFGMKCGSAWKGKSVNMSTKEEYAPGTLTSIKDNFRVYDSMEECVKGYFDFISTKRYANLKDALTPKQYLELIKQDGYATSSTYVQNNMVVVEKYNLTQYDDVGDALTACNPKWYVITANYLNLRSGPGSSYDDVGTLAKGSDIIIDKEENGWLHVDGWISKKYTRAFP